MRDDFLGADWSDNHARFTADINKLGKRIAGTFRDTFAALARQQFDAPWQHRWRQARIDRRGVKA